LAVDLDRVRKALRNLDGERALRNLLGRELGYEHEGGRISGDSYPEELEGDPTLFATAGREGRFSVIHTSFNTPGKLSLMAERKVMEKLRNRYPYALHIFSDAEDQLWHFLNVPHAERAGDKQYRRIIAGLVERMPQLEAPADTPQGTESATEQQEGAEPRPDTSSTQEGTQKPWWQFWR
jgi:hypothetical protein